jgi:cytochrome c-type biogenesis protein
MTEFLLALGSALWLGILTSISPCPLAANIVAMSFIARKVGSPRRVIVAGLLYTLGRTLVYVVIAVLLVGSILAAPQVSHVLQKYIGKLLGPVLIVAGMFILGLLSLPTRGTGLGEALQRRVESSGLWGAGLLGIVLGLSFCPISAALFFAGLIPIAVQHSSAVAMPVVFGIGTALPVCAFALMIALGARSVGKMFSRISQFELWARRITGVAFILVGIYYSLVYIFGLQLFPAPAPQ